MPFQPLRFIHAAHVNLDRPLADTGVLPDEIREIVQQAAVTAFERIVGECIAQRVDFLVLTENMFREHDRSLRARLALRSAFRQLADHDIGVFVLPGALDPASSWRSIPGLPDNVTTFRADSTEPVAVMRDGQVIATLTAVNGPIEPGSVEPSSHARPFSIGLLSAENAGLSEGDLTMSSVYSAFNVAPHAAGSRESAVDAAARRLADAFAGCGLDYLAIGSRQRVSCELDTASSRQRARHRDRIGTKSLVHSPGAAQAMFATESGQHGCSIIDVSADGDIDCRLLPLSPVRREAISLAVTADSSRNDLIEQMQQAADQLQLADNEQACLIDWVVFGSGALLQSALYAPFQEQLMSASEVEVLLGGVPFFQRILCIPSRNAASQRPTADNLAIEKRQSSATSLDPTLDSDIPLEFVSLLNDQAAMCRELMDQCLECESEVGEQSAQLQAIAVDVDPNAVMAHAHQAGERWLAPELNDASETSQRRFSK